MQKILIKKPETLKDYENPENWTPYNLLQHLHQTLQKQGDQNKWTQKTIPWEIPYPFQNLL